MFEQEASPSDFLIGGIFRMNFEKKLFNLETEIFEGVLDFHLSKYRLTNYEVANVEHTRGVAFQTRSYRCSLSLSLECFVRFTRNFRRTFLGTLKVKSFSAQV